LLGTRWDGAAPDLACALARGWPTWDGSNMPLYLVRWPTLTASLVQADDEDELLDILDQDDDPGGCTYPEQDFEAFRSFLRQAHVGSRIRRAGGA